LEIYPTSRQRTHFRGRPHGKIRDFCIRRVRHGYISLWISPYATEDAVTKRLTVQERKAIFRALVTAQDEIHNVRESYEKVAGHYEISQEQLRLIEDEGVENEWPPLAETVG
jgi:hypothetical protein